MITFTYRTKKGKILSWNRDNDGARKPGYIQKTMISSGEYSRNSLHVFPRCQSKYQQTENCNPYDTKMFPITQNRLSYSSLAYFKYFRCLLVFFVLLINIFQSHIFSIPWTYLFRDLKQYWIDIFYNNSTLTLGYQMLLLTIFVQ